MKTEWMANGQYRATLEFEQRGTVLAGILENPHASTSELLSQIREIVGDYLQCDPNGFTFYIIDHWVVYNPVNRYWGVYFKENHHSIYDAREPNIRGYTETFLNEKGGTH